MSKSKRTGSGLSVAVTLALAIATLYFARDVLIPIVLAVLLAFLLARPAGWLERRRLGRVPSVLAVVIVAFAFIGSMGYIVGQQAVSLAHNLDQYKGEIERKVKSVRGTGAGFWRVLDKVGNDFKTTSEAPATLPTSLPTSLPATSPETAVQDIAPAVPSAAGTTPAHPIYTVSQGQPQSPIQTLLTYLQLVAGPLGTAGLVVVFVIFILLEREALRDRFIAVISRGNYTVTTRAINDAAERISRYLLAQSMVNGSYGLIIGSGLFCIGLFFGHGLWFPSFVLWGLLCAVMRFIPYVGPAVSAMFPIALALAVYPGFTVAIAVVSLFVIIELISNNVMEPWLYGASTGLSTVAIIVAAVFWTWLWGSVGLLVATPLTVCLAVIGKYVAPLRFLHILLGDEDALPPAVSFYQRLLAGDRADAENVAQKVADSQLPSRVADLVYLPALRMARRDRAHDELTADVENRIFEDTLHIAQQRVEKSPTAPFLSENSPLILACPSHHRADEVTLQILSNALHLPDVRTTVMSTRSLPADIEAAIERDRPAVLVIAIMPPGGILQTRYLCRRLHRRFPDLPILVGYWGRARNFDKLLVRLRAAGASYVMTSLEQMCGQLAAMVRPPASVESTTGEES